MNIWMKRLFMGMGATAGGALASSLGLPLAWLIGAAVATAFVNLLITTVTLPIAFFRTGQVVLGVAVGLTVTAEIVRGLGVHLVIIPLAALVSLGLGRAFVPLYVRASGLDKTTAFFALIPAGIAEMADLSGKYGGDVGAVAILHALRVLMIVLVLPPLIYAFNETTLLQLPGPQGTLTLTLALGLALVIGLASGAAGSKMGLPSAYFIGPLFVLSVISGLGLISASEPKVMLAGAQVLLGFNLGTRFKRESVRRLPRALAAAVPVMALHAAIMAGLALVLAFTFGFPSPAMVLAFATGGSAEMVLTARTVGANAALVAIYQVTRGLLGNSLASLIYHRTIKRTKQKGNLI